MDRLSIYRGMAGEVIVGFLRPGTIFTSIPVIMVFVFLVAIPITFVPGLAGSGLDGLLAVLVSSYVVGRFMQPAREGHLAEGWFSHLTASRVAISYAFRYMAAVVLSGAPILVLALFLVFKMMGDTAWGLSGMGTSMGSLASAGLAGALVMVLLVLIALDVVLAYLMAAASDDYGDLLGLKPWSYLWYRKADVAMFFASAAGGVMAFWMIYFIPILLVSGMVSLVSEAAGAVAIGWGLMLPLALAPVLFGRLVGAFVAGDGEFDPLQRPVADLSPEAAAALAAARTGADPAAASAAASAGNGRLAPAPPLAKPMATPPAAPVTAESTGTTAPSVTVSAFSKEHVIAIAKEVEAVPADALDLARGKAQTAFQNDNHDLAAALRFGLICLRQEAYDDAVRALRLAVTELVAERSGAAAVQLYQSLGKHRTRLGLDKMTLEGLSRVLKLQGKYLDAAWCLYAAWAPTNPQNAQNHLTQIGLEAAQKEAWDDVQRIFRFLLQKHPDTSFKDKADAALAKAEQELALKAFKSKG